MEAMSPSELAATLVTPNVGSWNLVC